jgi:hypothetical protein
MNWEPSDRFDEWQGCRACIHYDCGRCVAYPKRIPLLILSGEVDHMVPRPWQVGDTVFEPIDFVRWVETGERVPAQTTTAERQSA